MELKNIKTLAGRLKYVRDQLDLSQAELAEFAQTTQQAIQQAESGKARNPRYLPQLSKAVGVPYEWLALNVLSPEQLETLPLSAQENELLSSFKAMPKKDQTLMLELMRSRRKTDETK